MGFSKLLVMRGRHEGHHHNFVVVALMTLKFGTGIKVDVFNTIVTKKFIKSLLLRNYDVITFTFSRRIGLNYRIL